MRQFAEFIVGRDRLIQLSMLLVTLLAAYFAAGISFEFSPQSVYEGQDDLLQFSEDHKRLFGHEDATIVLVVEATGPDDVLTPESLTWQKRLADRLAAVPRVQLVSGIVNLQNMRFRDAVPLVPTTPVEPKIAARVRRKVETQTLIKGTLISEDLRLTNLVIEFDPDARSMVDTRAVVEAVTEVIEKTPPPTGYQTHISGIAALRVDVVQNLLADQQVMFPLSGTLFLVIVILMFRDIKITLYALGAVFAGVIWSFGIIAALGQPFTLLSNSVPTLTLIIGAANVVHVVSRHLDELQHHNTDGKAAAIATMSEMSVTCMLTFATTAIGFGSLLISKSVVLRQFAFQASLGLVCQYFSVVLILGSALARTRSGSMENRTHRAAGWLVGRLGNVVSGRPIPVLIASFGVVLTCGILARGLAVNSFIYETYDSAHPTMQTVQLLDEKLSGLAAVEIQLATDDPESLFEPAVFEELLALQEELLRTDEVRYACSYVNLHMANAGADEELNKENIARFERNIRRAAKITRREFFITDDNRRARVLLRLRDIGSARMNALIDNLQSQLAIIFPEGDPIRATVTGDAFLHARCMDQFVRDMFYSLLTASIAIFAVISLLFRSLRTGLISAIPNMTPLAVTLGYIALRDYPLTAGVVIVFAITLGIAVDDTIHFLSRFGEERRKGLGIDESISAVFRSSGRAIVLTTVLIVSGLSVLLLSRFVPTRRFAELTAITMAAALLGDLLLLPACLVLFEKREGEPDYEDYEEYDDDRFD